VEHLHCGYAVLATSTEQIRTSTGYFILYSGTLIHTFFLLYYLCASPFLRQYSMAYTLSNEEKLKRVLNEVLGYAGKQGNAALSFLDKLGFLCGDDAALTLHAFFFFSFYVLAFKLGGLGSGGNLNISRLNGKIYGQDLSKNTSQALFTTLCPSTWWSEDS